ncbi:MAG TPA: SDR family oxidoreductase [Sporichthyaceae bacterium]|nr:SDR family oxidoreductase [Sporichthyaceae bacterium]
MSVLVITGGGRGIGAATARLAAARGWDLCLAFRSDRDAAEAVALECIEAGVMAFTVQADVAVEMDVIDLFEQAEQFGPLGGLVNNAGVISPVGPVAEMESEHLEEVFGVNVFGVFFCCREAVRRMQANGQGGAIVNVSSRAAVIGGAGRYVDYAASKAAVDTLTVGLSQEVAEHGIRVNGVRPGIVATDIHPDDQSARIATIPLRRLGTPEEIAEAIVWLLSPAASYITGATLDVGGGR